MKLSYPSVIKSYRQMRLITGFLYYLKLILPAPIHSIHSQYYEFITNMRRQITKSIQKGFTLIELLIVVVILGILAAVVVPQLSGVTDDAKLESLKSNLSNIRSAIDLYKQQHNDFPGVGTAVGTACPNSGTPGTGATTEAAAFASQLTMYTDIAGKACSTTNSIYKFGPYLKASAPGANGLPDNPFVAVNTVTMENDGNLVMNGRNTTGWQFDYTIGKFIADDTTDGHDTL